MTATQGFEVGQEVVAMVRPGVPCQCAGQVNPQHPCRVTITKVGRTKVYGLMTRGFGETREVAMTVPSLPDAKGLIAYPVEEAKHLYAAELVKHGNPRFRELVESL